MRIEDFGNKKTGELIEVDTTFGRDHAFIPDRFPPYWDYEVAVYRLLAEAKMELGRLDGIGKFLPNPNLLKRPLQRKEASAYSRWLKTCSSFLL